jgi:hypothetical protein
MGREAFSVTLFFEKPNVCVKIGQTNQFVCIILSDQSVFNDTGG